MVFESIEKLKADWTDKYVITDESRPELRRFSGLTGTVKTVNMSGRCLVEFDGRANIGWYDIEPSSLKIIPEPLKKPEAKEGRAAPKAEAKKPAAEAPKAAAPVAKGGGNVADILSAARGGAKPAAAPATAKPASSSTADILAAARGKAAPAAPKAEAAAPKPAAAPPKADAKSMSVNDILAAARGKASAPAAPAAPAAAPPAPAKKVEPAPVVAKEEPAHAPAATASSGGSKRGAFATIDEIVAYCKQVDNKG